MAQSLQCPTLDPSSGLDLRVQEFKPRAGLRIVGDAYFKKRLRISVVKAVH